MRGANRPRTQHHFAPSHGGDTGTSRIKKNNTCCYLVLNSGAVTSALVITVKLPRPLAGARKAVPTTALAIVNAAVKLSKTFLTIATNILTQDSLLVYQLARRRHRSGCSAPGGEPSAVRQPRDSHNHRQHSIPSV